MTFNLVTRNDSQLIAKAITDLDKTFILKSLGSISYFLGFEAITDDTQLKLTQRKYLRDLLHQTNMLKSNATYERAWLWSWVLLLMAQVLVC